jgi:KipI family sensor histidine kinase inhibitor
VSAPRFLPCGDSGLTVQFEGADLRATNARALALHRALGAAPPEGLVETVPAYRSVTLHYDPLRTTQATLAEAVRAALAAPEAAGDAPRRWCLPVCFEADHAPDLAEVSRRTGLTETAIVAALTETEQSVYMLGFAPGQPYLGDLPAALDLPRRREPVARVPAGSVLTATAKTVIYPVDNPTGWYVLGRTPVALFDPDDPVPVLLAPGDLLRCTPVGAAEFAALQAERGALRARLIAEAGA